MAKLNQYELTTTKTERNGMPFQVYASTRVKALKFAKPRLFKGEKIISLRRVR